MNWMCTERRRMGSAKELLLVFFGCFTLAVAESTVKFIRPKYSASIRYQEVMEGPVDLFPVDGLTEICTQPVTLPIVHFTRPSDLDFIHLRSDAKDAANGQWIWCAQVWLDRTALGDTDDPIQFRIGAQSDDPYNQDETLVTIAIEGRPRNPLKFTANRYFAEVDSRLPGGSTILRVKAANFRPSTYSLESSREDFVALPNQFDIDPITGDIFTLRQLTPGKFTFRVVASHQSAPLAQVPVIIRVTDGQLDPMEKDDKFGVNRRRRSVRSTYSFRLPENTRLGLLAGKKIPLTPAEVIRSSPSDSKHFHVHQNGSLELTRELNFELERDLQFSVVVENVKTKLISGQRVVVNVTDVDERPKFINHPVPYQAVVPSDVPVGYTVFKFQAKDEAGDGDTDVRFILINSEPEGMFTIDESGRVKTTKSHYQPGQEYKVFVQAQDVTEESDDKATSKSDVAVLSVMVDRRPPQFLEAKYSFGIAEDTPPQASVAHVQAKTFQSGHQPRPIVYTLQEARSQKPSDSFEIDSETGIIRLKHSLDADDPNQQKTHELEVWALEDDMRSKAKLDLHVVDVNDHDPMFSQPLYSKTILEDFPPGQPIIVVSAKDKDQGLNAEIVYSVDNHNFTVNERGEISALNRLDADQFKQGFFIYKFNVTARDRGNPSRSALSVVQIRTENVNDEAPVMVPLFTEYVSEDAKGETPITTIEATDPDRDKVTYYFLTGDGQQTSSDQFFSIDEDTGLIKLKDGVGERDLPKRNLFNLTVVAVDDGSCCPVSKGQPRHSSTATVLIGVKGVNSNKPVFRDCSSYSSQASVPEGKHANRTILTVTATDEDSGSNGQIIYSLYYPKGETRRPFDIDSVTGEIRASPYFQFDREERALEEITVKARDKGTRPLIGFCHFTVTITDVNDHYPEFDKSDYETTISRTMGTGKSVLTPLADDRDGPANSKITYSLREDPERPNDVKYFSIRPDSGEVMLANVIPAQMAKLVFFVVAEDNGVPQPKETAAKVTLNIAESPDQQYPVWETSIDCKDEVFLDENVLLNSVVVKCIATPGVRLTNGRIQYSLSNGVKPETNSNGDFRVFHEKGKTDGRDYAVIRNLKNLDADKIQKYTLTLTAQDLRNGLSREKKVVVKLIDKNDNVPKFPVDKFTAFVVEEQEPTPFVGKPITKVTATDADITELYRKIKYKIVEGTPASQMFVINQTTGEIWANDRFDREKTDIYILDVEAEDSADSHLPESSGPNRDLTKVQIQVHDINDNDPYFNVTLYTANVKEDAEIGATVSHVKAHDRDINSELKYSIDPVGNIGSAFNVRANSGTIYVNERLDYESIKLYRLMVWANDGHHRTSTMVEVKVLDVNDNSPVFSQSLYEKNIYEENHDQFTLPHKILQVTATDRDEDSSSQQLIYKLEGQGANDAFSINNQGEIFVNKPLNRDPPDGIEEYNMIVQAIDDNGKGLVGYADVQVTLLDINDEYPTFLGSPVEGFIDENQNPGANGVFVMSMTAVDADDPSTENARLTYDIQRNKHIGGQPIFRVEPSTGKIYAMRMFDREDAPQKAFEITVRATDNGSPPRQGTGIATIKVRDRNDNPPTFDPPSYTSSVKETAEPGYPILTVSAQDKDNEAVENKLQYRILDTNILTPQYFYMTSDPDSSGSTVGILRVLKKLDFEDKSQRNGFNLTVEVTDGQFQTTAPVYVKLTDENDNPPAFRDFLRSHHVKEDVTVGTNITRVPAYDVDNDGQDEFEFFINKTSDPRRQFHIGPKDGVLRVEGRLDREAVDHYSLQIGAQDQAGNIGYTSVTIYVDDINDNSPLLVPQNDPVVMENSKAPVKVATVYGRDLDSPENGPPFRFAEPQNSNVKNLFRIDYKPELDNRRGGVEIWSKAEFDREVAKFYDVPIWVQDSGKPPMSDIQYLRVVVGDVNDNPMTDGSKEIRVFSYKGQLPRSQIGSVYVTDLDDWDVVDKSFLWISGKPDYFELDERSGNLFIESMAPEGKYIFQVKVRDKRRDETAVGTVTVLVEYLPEDAFLNSGSVRIQGMSAEDFISKKDLGTGLTPIEKFRQKLAEYVSLPERNVQIFSVMPVAKANSPMIDVRFAAHGSPYRQSMTLNGLVEFNRKELENYVGVVLYQIDVNECLNEYCEGGCTNLVTARAEPTVVNANSTSLVGVTTMTNASCSCPAVNITKRCHKYSCYNNGICHETGDGYFCECRDSNLKGPRCEGKTRSFNGNGFAWFRPLKQCEKSHMSFHFLAISKHENGVLLYNGPMNVGSSVQYVKQDFILIELIYGKPVVTINLGSGVKVMQFPKDRGNSLADGNWHRIDIYRNKQTIQMTVDKCQKAQMSKISGSDVPDFNGCRVIDRIPGNNEFLTVTTPLQLGGLALSPETNYPLEVLNRRNFAGCIRELIVDGELYDLSQPAYHNSSQSGCSQTDSKCLLSADQPYCAFGECVSDYGTEPKCSCDPGYHGPRCSERNTPIRFDHRSFQKYHAGFERSPNAADVKILFTPAKPDGTLTRASDSLGSEYMALQLDNWKLRYEYNFGDGSSVMKLPNLQLYSNQSYWLHLERYNTHTRLSVDNLGGRFMTEQFRGKEEAQLITLTPGNFFLGADNDRGDRSMEHFTGCILDFRWDDNYMPLTTEEETKGRTAGKIVSSTGVSPGCQSVPSCAMAPWRDMCGHKHFQECRDFWKGPFCTCISGSQPELTDSGTLRSCRQEAAALSLGITSGAVTAILVSLMMLIILVLFLVAYTRRRKPIIYLSPEYDVRDNIVNYLEEGGGEEDQHSYDITRLRKPILPMDGDSPSRKPLYPESDTSMARRMPRENGEIADFIHDRLVDANMDPSVGPFDELRQFGDEGRVSRNGSLSSLESADPLGDSDPNFVAWGPRFNRLASLYYNQ